MTAELNPDVLREIPLDGVAIATPKQRWLLRVCGARVVPNSTIRVIDLECRSEEATIRCTLEIPGEILVVEHREGDIRWLVEHLQLQLRAETLLDGDTLRLT